MLAQGTGLHQGPACRGQGAQLPLASRPATRTATSARSSAASSGPCSTSVKIGAPAGQARAFGQAPSSSIAPARQLVLASASASAGSQSAPYDVVVVGGGISGLVTAQALKAKHGMANFLVTESRERVGGNITSMSGDGYVWEEGPNSFQPNESMLQVAVDSGCEQELVFGDPTAPRFVLWGGRLRPVPSGLDAFTFDLMSIIGKIRAGLGAVGLLKGGPMPEGEESVEQFIRRNLGAEVFERLIEPFCSGVYAGDPSKLSMQAAFGKIWILEKEGGSLIGGAIKLAQRKGSEIQPPRDPRLPPKPKGQTVGSFRSGLQTLPIAIARTLGDAIKVSWKLTQLSKDTSTGLYRLQYDTPEGPVTTYARTVALTTPSYVAAELFKDTAPEASKALNSFDYPPVGAVTVSYPLSSVREDRRRPDGSVPGFGQLHPRTQSVVTLGTIYSSSLFPGRAPEGHILLLNYIGGATNRGILDQSHEALVEQVDKDLRTMLIKPDAPKARMVGVRVWPKAIPQFNKGHLDTLEAARSALATAGMDGVLLGGNYVAGVALGKCVEYGYEYAGMLAAKAKAKAALPMKTPAAV